jgi:hypothetical protein
MMFKRKRLWIIPIIVALVAVAGVFAAPNLIPRADQVDVALAAESDQSAEHCIKANEEQLDKMKELWGKDISYIEFLKQVFPEVWKDIPQDRVELDQEMAERGHVTKFWPRIQEGLPVEDLSDIQIRWGIIDNEAGTTFWVRITSDSGQIERWGCECFDPNPIDKFDESGNYQMVMGTYDSEGRPINKVVAVPPELLQSEDLLGEYYVPPEVVAEALDTKSASSASAEPLAIHEKHQWAWQKAYWYGACPMCENCRAKQGFEWDGENVVDAWDEGSDVWGSADPQLVDEDWDSFPTPPCWRHTIYQSGTWDYYGFWDITLETWGFGYGDGTTGHKFEHSGHGNYEPDKWWYDWSPK